MILTIDTIDRNKINIGLYENTQEGECFEIETKNQSDDILVSINDILSKNGVKLSDLTAILVNRGPGSFTGVRVGVTVANTLAWSLNIPVFGYREGNIDAAKTQISKEKKFSKIALPFYPDK